MKSPKTCQILLKGQQTFSSISQLPPLKSQTHFWWKKINYSFLVHNTAIFSKKRSIVRIALLSLAWHVKTAHWDTEPCCIICRDPSDLICIKKERLSSILCSKSIFNLKTHSILKICWKYRDLCRQWRCQLIFFVLFSIVQIQIIQTSSLYKCWHHNLNLGERCGQNTAKNQVVSFFVLWYTMKWMIALTFPYPPCYYLEETVKER